MRPLFMLPLLTLMASCGTSDSPPSTQKPPNPTFTALSGTWMETISSSDGNYSLTEPPGSTIVFHVDSGGLVTGSFQGEAFAYQLTDPGTDPLVATSVHPDGSKVVLAVYRFMSPVAVLQNAYDPHGTFIGEAAGEATRTSSN